MSKEQDNEDNMDKLRRSIKSELYNFLSGDSVPKEQVKPLGSYKPGNYIGWNISDEKLKTLEGFEKVIAACHILGEDNYSPGNIIVQEQKMQKIGHAFSVSGFHENFESMVKSTYNALELFSYGDHIRKGNLNFNVEKYSNSLKQMISKLEGRQVEDIVDQKIAELKTAGLDLKSRSTVEIDPNTKRGVFIPFTFERFKKEYMNGINQNLASIKEISRNIEIITKFDDKGLPDGFKNGAWIKEFFDTQQSPIEYAKRHSITIEGMEASAWKEREDAKMIAKAQGENKQPSPLVDNKQQPEARSTESQKEKTTQGIQLATLEDAKMIAKAQGENKQPTPLVDNKQQPEARSTESQKEQTATKDNQQGVPLTSTPLWKEKLEKISQKDKEQQAIKKIEGHTEEFAKGPQDRKAIKQLYGKIVDALETGGAIIPAHATYMKKDEGYKEGFMKEPGHS